MNSAFILCLFSLAASVLSTHLESSNELEVVQLPISDRRTFKHSKPVKFVPLFKHHKKIGGWIPHSSFGKTEYVEVPAAHEIPSKPIFKVHRYQGIEVKPVSPPEPVPETVVEHQPFSSSSDDFPPPTLSSSFPSPPSLGPIFLKPPAVLPPTPFFSSPLPAKPVFSFIPAAQPAILPIKLQHPAPLPVPIYSPPSVPILSQFQIQTPISSFPAPTFTPIPIIPQPSFSHFPAALPSPPTLSSVSPLPPSGPLFSPTLSSLPSLPSPAPVLSSATPEPEYPYPPSGTPIPSYIKDISLHDVSDKDAAPPKVETPNFDEINSAIDTSNTKSLDLLGVINSQNGFLQKFKDKANTALNHFSHFKQKPIVHQSLPVTDKAPVEVPVTNTQVYPGIHFPGLAHSLPSTPDFKPPAVFLPSPHILPPVKYENFPPNHVLPPPLFNSYGLPIPHDSYAPPSHTSHDRVSPAASEEQPSVVVPPPAFEEQNNQQNLKESQVQKSETQQVSQIVPEFQTKSLRQSPPQFLSQDQPIFVPDQTKTENDDNKTIEEINSMNSEYKDNYPTQESSEEVGSTHQGHHNHKEQ